MSRESEALALRDEWTRLQAEGSALAIMTERLERSDDVHALRMHQQRLHQHQSELRALVNAMEVFHHTHGAIGGLRSWA